MKEFRSNIQPKGINDFVNFEQEIEEMNLNLPSSMRIELGKDLVIKQNHRAAYGCKAYQIVEANEKAKAAFNYFNIDLE